jgi:RecB family endonuclease NucS
MRLLVARCEIAYHDRAVTRLGVGDRVILFKDAWCGNSEGPRT